MSSLYQRFFRITLKCDAVQLGTKNSKTFFLMGQRKANGWFFGREVRNHTNNGFDVIRSEKNELTVVDADAVAKWTEYFEDRKYGWLTRKTQS